MEACPPKKGKYEGEISAYIRVTATAWGFGGIAEAKWVIFPNGSFEPNIKLDSGYIGGGTDFTIKAGAVGIITAKGRLGESVMI